MHKFKFNNQNKFGYKKIIFGIISCFLILFILFTYYIIGPFREFFWDLPKILGFFGERQYLIILQNNYEKRPTGGFISSFAVIKTYLGNVDSDINDSYDIEAPKSKIEPPYPLNELLSGDKFYQGWVFRDANWSPDFKTSVKDIITIYDKGIGRYSSFDGVIAIDMEILKKLLEVTGEIEVNGIKFNSENYYYLIQTISKNIDLHNKESLKERKNFLQPLTKKIVSYFIYNPFRIKNLLWKQKELLDEKHIQIFFSNDKLQGKIENLGWGGNFNTGTGDYIHINIANIGGRKSDRYISKINMYDVTFDEKGNAIGELRIMLKHKGTKSLISDFYQSYIRIYLPKDIKIISTKGEFKDNKTPHLDLNSLVVSGIIHMQPGENREINIKYELPKYINRKNYNLMLIPQSGNTGENWHISIQNTTDHIWEGNIDTRENVAFFDSNIKSNKKIFLRDIGDSTPPIVVWQRFIDDNIVEINFSEKIDLGFTKNLSNISIIDKNQANNISDNVKVSKMSFDKNNSLFISLDGITVQPREFYNVSIKNVMDSSGNHTNPNPLEITIVR